MNKMSSRRLNVSQVWYTFFL